MRMPLIRTTIGLLTRLPLLLWKLDVNELSLSASHSHQILHTHSADHHHSQTQAKCIAWAAGTRLALYDFLSTPQVRCRCCGDNPSPTDSAAALPVE
jgi:hypothetical protein